MKRSSIRTQLLVPFFISPLANAADECTLLTGFDICKYARRFVDDFSAQLPMRMSENLTLEKASAYKRVVSFYALLGYNEEFLKTVAQQNGVSMKQISQAMESSTKATLCEEKSSTNAFISLGGGVQYFYRFSDGKPYLTVNVKECK